MESPQRKRARREARAKSEDDSGTTQSPENPLNSNTYLSYDILRIIFRYINAKDLSNAALVCRSWSEAANKEYQTRGPCCLWSSWNDLNDPEYLWIKPTLAFYFTTNRNLLSLVFNRTIYKNCTTLFAATMGIVMDERQIGRDTPTILCAFVPNIPNVVIKKFELTKENDYADALNMINKMPTPNHEISTCLILFCNHECRYTAISLTEAIKDSNDNKLTSLYGGVVKNQRAFPEENKNYRHAGINCIGILISGPIQTWSIILERKCKSKEQIETRLKLWKDRIKLEKHSLAFMFACHARGERSWKKYPRVLEWTIFKNIFPKVPIVGCFGDGEFGKNTISLEAIDKNCTWYNEYSTVFMILTYG